MMMVRLYVVVFCAFLCSCSTDDSQREKCSHCCTLFLEPKFEGVARIRLICRVVNDTDHDVLVSPNISGSWTLSNDQEMIGMSIDNEVISPSNEFALLRCQNKQGIGHGANEITQSTMNRELVLNVQKFSHVDNSVLGVDLDVIYLECVTATNIYREKTAHLSGVIKIKSQ
jgi:hypothetical protein